MKRNIVTAQDVAEATGQSIESVARDWHDIATDQSEIEAEGSSSDERHRITSGD
ncbi:hypothetical protein [Natronolimnohabitans innermongolicus]|uniref:hypothetical protein n=1 Tax=Natronolimnohabitans innermongolicus TaxID=253107 RepID=UPI0013757B9A|nr:hypothetical protein [Natronolimnohabitans innermongolicus]